MTRRLACACTKVVDKKSTSCPFFNFVLTYIRSAEVHRSDIEYSLHEISLPKTLKSTFKKLEDPGSALSTATGKSGDRTKI
jgi:hypothetical protein